MKLLNTAMLKDNIEKIANYDLENNKIFGSSYGVISNGNVVYKKALDIHLLTKNVKSQVKHYSGLLQ